jgi:hypothetical protein
MIHVEGMGVLGSVLARHLTWLSIDWTWDDTDDPHAAWQASTGLVYPDADPAATADLHAWGLWSAAGLFAADELRPAAYVYAQKTPPHGGRYGVLDLGDGLHLANADCWQVDPPRLVANVRREHRDRRRNTAPPGATLIRAHGRVWRHTWGWSAPVRLDTSALPELPHAPALIGRRISVNVYAYPMPSRPGWWRAGSAMYDQRAPRSLDADAHLTRWLIDYKARFPTVPVVEVGAPVEGWRPRPAPDASPGVTRDDDGALRVPALWHSGVRRAPTVIRQLLNALEAA